MVIISKIVLEYNKSISEVFSKMLHDTVPKVFHQLVATYDWDLALHQLNS